MTDQQNSQEKGINTSNNQVIVNYQNDMNEIKFMIKNLIDQMGTMLKLLTTILINYK